MARKPTQKQIECYYLAEIFRDPKTGKRLTHQEIGQMLNVKRSNVTYRLLRLKKNHPGLFPHDRRCDKPKKEQQLNIKKHDKRVEHKF